MGFFDDIGQISASQGGGNRLGPGSYPRLEITDVTINEAGFYGPRFVVEFRVIESDGPDATPSGRLGSWTAKLDGPYAKASKEDVKAFVGAALGHSNAGEIDAAVTPAVMAQVIDGDLLRGREVSTDAWAKTTKGGHQFVKHAWHPVSADASPTPAVAPPAPPAPAPAPAFPPEGWTAHPTPGYYYRGQQVVTEADLRAGKVV